MPIKVSDVRVDKQAQNLLIATKNESFLADAFLPEVRVKDDSGIVPVWGNAHMRTYELRRSANDTELHYVELEAGTDKSYKVEYYDATHKVPKIVLEQQEDPYDLLAMSAISARQIIKLNRDIALAAQLTSTTVLTNNTTLAGNSRWDVEHADSTPMADIETGRTTVFNAIGMEANAIYMSRAVAAKLKQHADYVNYYANGKVAPGGMSDNQLIQVLKDLHDFDFVFIGKTSKITSKKGQTVTRAQVFGNDCVIFYRSALPNIMAPSFGYSFIIPDRKFKTQTWFDEATKKFYNVEAQVAFDDKILMPEAAYLIKSCIS